MNQNSRIKTGIKFLTVLLIITGTLELNINKNVFGIPICALSALILYAQVKSDKRSKRD